MIIFVYESNLLKLLFKNFNLILNEITNLTLIKHYLLADISEPLHKINYYNLYN